MRSDVSSGYDRGVVLSVRGIRGSVVVVGVGMGLRVEMGLEVVSTGREGLREVRAEFCARLVGV